MHFITVCLFLLGTLSYAASSNQLTLLLQFESEPSNTSISALDAELKSIMAASHIPLRFKVQTKPLQGSVEGELIVFRMKGICSMDTLPIAAVSDERGPLAMTHVVNGEILPFADVECNRIRESVQRTLGRGNPSGHQSQYGAALARVMAHEMYHILAKSTTHQDAGLTKRSLSSRELTTGRMLLSDHARSAFVPSP